MPRLNTAAIATTLKSKQSTRKPKQRLSTPSESTRRPSGSSYTTPHNDVTDLSEFWDETPDFSERALQIRLRVEELNKFNECETIRYKHDGYRFPQPCTLKLKTMTRYVLVCL